MYNFKVPVVDTDSLMVCKQDQSPFTKEEIDRLSKELNALFPDTIFWEFESEYKKVIVAKAKNYILWDGSKLTIKGSAFKSSSKEPALKDFTSEIINAIIENQTNYAEIYEKYVQEILNITDIKRWCSKKTVSEKVMKSERTNEKKIRDAIVDLEHQSGDKVYVYFKEDDSLGLVDTFDGNYSRIRLLEKLHKSSQIFKTVLPVAELFPNYKLKKNMKKLFNIQEKQMELF